MGEMYCAGTQYARRHTQSKQRSATVRTRLKFVIPVFAAGAVAGAIAAAPTSAAQIPFFCTNLSTSATKCEYPGDVEINDSLSRANTLPQLSSSGGATGGPYGGSLGGGSR
jgi:hypothetical protein